MFSAARDESLTSGVGSPEQTDNERRIADIVKMGKVVEADYPKGRVRVGIGEEDDEDGYILTGWLPMSQAQSGEWNPLKIGESVVVFSEGGELQNGVAMRATINSADKPAVGDRGDLYRKRFEDGSVIEYDEASGSMRLTGKSIFEASVGGASIVITENSITLTAGGQTLVVGSDGVESSGKIKGGAGLEVTGPGFTHEGVNVGSSHHHTAVQPGGGLSGTPQQ